MITRKRARSNNNTENGDVTLSRRSQADDINNATENDAYPDRADVIPLLSAVVEANGHEDGSMVRLYAFFHDRNIKSLNALRRFHHGLFLFCYSNWRKSVCERTSRKRLSNTNAFESMMRRVFASQLQVQSSADGQDSESDSGSITVDYMMLSREGQDVLCVDSQACPSVGCLPLTAIVNQ